MHPNDTPAIAMTSDLQLPNQAITYLWPEEDGTETWYSERQAVAEIDISEPDRAVIGYDTVVTGVATWSADPGGYYRVEKTIQHFSGHTLRLEGVASDSGDWRLTGDLVRHDQDAGRS